MGDSSSGSASSVFDSYKAPLTQLWEIQTESGTDVVLLAAELSKRIYLSFRGTDGERADFGTDIDLRLVEYGDQANATVTFSKGKVHRGFNGNLFGDDKLYLTLDESIRSTMAQFCGYQLVITGHSLGGALAILYGVHVAKTVLPDTNVLVQTIGTPRIGDKEFKASARGMENLANWRVVYKKDVIPRIPLRRQGYSHVGHLIFLRDQETEAYFDQMGDSVNFAGVGDPDWLLPTRFNAELAVPVFHHIPWSYLAGIARAKSEGWWPTKFVGISEQGKLCCFWLTVFCLRYCQP